MTKPRVDSFSEMGCRRLVSRIADYWSSHGSQTVSVTAYRGHHIPKGYVWHIQSNLVNGLPPDLLWRASKTSFNLRAR
jgi:hypothetical protein